jgi:hypothetical protein
VTTRTVIYLRTADEAAMAALLAPLYVETRDGPAPTLGMHVDMLGVVYKPTGATITVNGIMQPEMVASAGWHCNLLFDGIDVPQSLLPHTINPAHPKRVYLGYSVLSMPEATEDDGDVILVERPIGAQASALAIDRAQAEHVRRKLAAEARADRRALHQATLAVIEQRAVRDALVEQREALQSDLTRLRADRDAAVIERNDAISTRDATIAALVPLTGAARAPLVAIRGAATARAQAAASKITQLGSQIATADAAREDVVARVAAANAELLRLRAARDGLK